MDSTYLDPSILWNRISSSLLNLKTIIKDSSIFNSSITSASDTTQPSNVFFSAAEPDSALTEFVKTHHKQILSILGKILGISIAAITSYLVLKWLIKSIDPTNADKLSAKSRAEEIMKQLGVDPKKEQLNEYEMFIASNIILPAQIDCSWEDIGGLDHIADELRETVIYPLKDFGENNSESSSSNAQQTTGVLQQTKRSRLVQPPKGVLLFGPPGNAKTMIAKALAKDSGARFINLQVSTLFDKWFGESQKRTEAVFSLAEKVQPVIIFIDEIDSFLRSRRTDDHECTSTMKTQFMTLWDGLTTSTQKQNRILIIGATNRPEDVDPAILRRMPQMFHIGLPSELQRIKILRVILKDECLAEDVNLDQIAAQATFFSGSDLHELCRCAAMNSFIESVRKSKNNEQTVVEPLNNTTSQQPHTIRKIDFDVAFEKMAVKVTAMNSRNRFDFEANR